MAKAKEEEEKKEWKKWEEKKQKKKVSERIPTKNVWDHAIEVKEEFVLSKEKIYPLSREERGEVQEFIKEELRKEYIKLSTLS